MNFGPNKTSFWAKELVGPTGREGIGKERREEEMNVVRPAEKVNTPPNTAEEESAPRGAREIPPAGKRWRGEYKSELRRGGEPVEGDKVVFLWAKRTHTHIFPEQFGLLNLLSSAGGAKNDGRRTSTSAGPSNPIGGGGMEMDVKIQGRMILAAVLLHYSRNAKTQNAKERSRI